MNLNDFLAKVTAEVTHEPCAWGRRVNPTGERAQPCDHEPAHLLALRDEDGERDTVYLPLCGEHHDHVRATLLADGGANFVRAEDGAR